MSFLIVGLGNPGSKYSDTRHNIGFMCIDSFADKTNSFWKEKFKGDYATYSLGLEKGYLLKPMTYMNLSGESVQKASSFFKVDTSNIIVIHDELDLPFGVVELKKGGGLAGHNGLKSIAECMGTRDFLRMRLGIGRPQYGDVSNYVLSNFSSEEQTSLNKFIVESEKIIEEVIVKGFDKVAPKCKKKNLI